MAVKQWRRGDAVSLLRATVQRGGVVAIPTESSYGLGVDPQNAAAVSLVYDIKGRDSDQPLPVVVADLSQARSLGVDVGDPAVRWAAKHWPAPLTVVAPLDVPLAATMGLDRLALRIPDHELLLALLEELGPLTATSANRSREAPCLGPDEVAELLSGRDAAVVDGGVLIGGLPSTVVSWGAGKLQLLRAGRFPFEPSGGGAAGTFSAGDAEITVNNPPE